MRGRGTHTHPCQRCGQRTACNGTFTNNHDGWPEAICDHFHRPGGVNPDFLCEECRANLTLHLDTDDETSETAPL